MIGRLFLRKTTVPIPASVEITALIRAWGGGDQTAEVISDNAFEDDIDTQQVELLGEVERIGVQAEGCEHLGTHRNDLSVHALEV